MKLLKMMFVVVLCIFPYTESRPNSRALQYPLFRRNANQRAQTDQKKCHLCETDFCKANPLLCFQCKSDECKEELNPTETERQHLNEKVMPTFLSRYGLNENGGNESNDEKKLQSPTPSLESNIGAGRYFTVGEIRHQATIEFLSQLLGVENGDVKNAVGRIQRMIVLIEPKPLDGSSNGTTEDGEPIIADLANILGERGRNLSIIPRSTSGDGSESECRAFNVDLADQFTKKLDKAMKDRKKELKVDKLSRAEMEKIIENIMNQITAENIGNKGKKIKKLLSNVENLPNSNLENVRENQNTERDSNLEETGNEFENDVSNNPLVSNNDKHLAMVPPLESDNQLKAPLNIPEQESQTNIPFIPSPPQLDSRGSSNNLDTSYPKPLLVPETPSSINRNAETIPKDLKDDPTRFIPPSSQLDSGSSNNPDPSNQTPFLVPETSNPIDRNRLTIPTNLREKNPITTLGPQLDPSSNDNQNVEPIAKGSNNFIIPSVPETPQKQLSSSSKPVNTNSESIIKDLNGDDDPIISSVLKKMDDSPSNPNRLKDIPYSLSGPSNTLNKIAETIFKEVDPSRIPGKTLAERLNKPTILGTALKSPSLNDPEEGREQDDELINNKKESIVSPDMNSQILEDDSQPSPPQSPVLSLASHPIAFDNRGEFPNTGESRGEESHQFGRLVPVFARGEVEQQRPGGLQKMYFDGKNIKLPLEMVRDKDGIYKLSVDTHKLCNCGQKDCAHAGNSSISSENGRNRTIESVTEQIHEEQVPEMKEKDLKETVANRSRRDVESLTNELEKTKIDDISVVVNDDYDDDQKRDVVSVEKLDELYLLEERLEKLNGDVNEINKDNENLFNKGTVALIGSLAAAEELQQSVGIVKDVLELIKDVSLNITMKK